MIGIGGSTVENELNSIFSKAHLIDPIQKTEFQLRIDKACKLMHEENVSAMYLHAGTNLYYFTGMSWSASERMVGAILFPNGGLHYIAPEFEKGTVLDFMEIEGDVHCWEEHESPYQLFASIMVNNNVNSGTIAMDEGTPFFIIEGISQLQWA